MRAKMNLDEVLGVAGKSGALAIKPIAKESIAVAEWVRMKCQFGCDTYGRNITCPPYTPDLDFVRNLIESYSTILLMHFQYSSKDEDEYIKNAREINKNVVTVERELFLKGFYKVFSLHPGPCKLCGKSEDCKGITGLCNNPLEKRSSPEGFGIDLFTTARSNGFPIEVVQNYKDTENHYGLLYIE